MSSGFVSGGTADAPIDRSDEWLAAQKEIEANRQRKLDAQARLSSGKSLYETLEANKAAKQEAFEEANKLKNQFRALDQDEIEFLDLVLESTRKAEENVKKETREGLEAFRKQQEEQEKRAREQNGDAGIGQITIEDSWGTASGRKRKRVKEKEILKGVKVRRGSTDDGLVNKGPPTNVQTTKTPTSSAPQNSKEAGTTSEVDKTSSAPSQATSKAAPLAAKKSSLVAYASESDDE